VLESERLYLQDCN